MGKRLFIILFFIFVLTIVSAAEFTVQISAFKDESEAKTMVSDFSEKGYPVYYVRADLGDKGIWYRVRLGRFSDSDKAKTYGKEFKIREKLDFFVTGYQEPYNTDEEIPFNSSFSGSGSDTVVNETGSDTEIDTYTDTGSYEVIVDPKIIDLGDSVIFSIHNDTETLPVIHTET